MVHKYRAVKTIIDGIEFDSKKEANRYMELCLLLRARQIKDLRLQVFYPIIINGFLVCKYVADFVYEENGRKVVEDTKGFKTPEYKLKKKLLKAVCGIDIFET